MGASSSSPSPLLGASVALNLSVLLWWVITILYNDGGKELATSHVGWTRTVTVEAEGATTHNCSGRDSVYAEMFFQHKKHDNDDAVSCECEECFTGPHCEHVISDCKAFVDTGDPLFFLPYWKQNPEASAVLIPGWYRMGYELSQPLIPVLEKEIRALHSLVGNAVTEGRYIVIGSGATQLMMAAYSTISMEAQGLPVRVSIMAPYYDAYERQIKTIQPGAVTWEQPSADAEAYVPLELVISPNNPDGSLRTSVVDHPRARTVFDYAYYWPHFTPITGALDNDIMLFTLSKTTGHAGSRIGWAIVKDYAVYEKLLLSVRLNSVGSSHESQLRAAQLLRSVREGYSKWGHVGLNKAPEEYAARQLLFHYGHSKLQRRWDRMAQILEGSDRFSIDQNLESKYCNFFKETVRQGPAFAWIRCLKEEDQDCVAIFEAAGIVGRGGARCGMTDRHVRLAMMSADFAFDNLLRRVQALVSQ